MAAYTYRDLITRSLRLFGGLARNATMSGQQGQQSLETLKEEIDALNAYRLFQFSHVNTVSPLVANQQDYLIGVGQAINIARPVRIEGVWIRNNTNSPAVDTPTVELTSTDWANIVSKGTLSNIPGYFTYDPTMPYGTLRLYPKPQVSGSYSIVTLTQVALDSSITLDTVVSLPPGYQKAFTNVLAQSLANEYGMPVPPQVATAALEAKQLIESNNWESQPMEFDFYGSAHGWYNVITDQFNN